MALINWILAIGLLIGVSNALVCTPIPDNQIQPGHTVTIPAGANETQEIPANFNCIYLVTVPPMVYAHVRLENKLKGSNDMITVFDQQNTRTWVTSRSDYVSNFYVFPNTTTMFQVVTKSVNMHSAFRMVVSYQSLLPATVTKLDNENLRYFTLNDLQANSNMHPQTIVADEAISVSIASSGWDYDVFDNFFLLEGTLDDPLAIYRMNRFVRQNYISAGKVLTIVGLDNRVSESAVVFSPLSQVQNYDSLTGISTYWQYNELSIDATSGMKERAVNVISMTDGVMILDAQMTSPCTSLKAVRAPPSSTSEVLLDFSTVHGFPRNITLPSFSIIAENCVASFRMVSPFPTN